MNKINKMAAEPYLETIITTCQGRDIQLIISGRIVKLDRQKVKEFLARVKDFDRSIFRTLSGWVGIYTLTE